MRLLATAALSLALAACAARTPAPVEQPRPLPPQPAAQRPTGDLLGLTVGELGQRFGQPSFQVREGPGLKLQWSGGGCVLDAYLYTPANGRGVERVTHVDTRRVSGDPMDQASCIALLNVAQP